MMNSMTTKELHFWNETLAISNGCCKLHPSCQIVFDGSVQICQLCDNNFLTSTNSDIQLVQRVLQAQQASIDQKNQTIKALRKTIQYDLKVIKSVQDQLGEEGSVHSSPMKQMHQQLSIPEEEPVPDDEPTSTSRAGPLRDSLKHQVTSNAKIFQSFRGGLLDIPKSPPQPNQASKDGNPFLHKRKQVLRLNSDAKNTLGLGTLSSHSSHHLTDSAHSKPSPKEIKLDKLALSAISSSSGTNNTRRLSGKSPEHLFPHKGVSASTNKETANLPIAPGLDAEEGPAPSNKNNNNDDDNSLFSVTNASCSDKFGDTGSYTGRILGTNSLPHEEGKMEYDSGRVYTGQWKLGQWHGNGRLQNPNGDIYTGEFLSDARHGTGTYEWDNGDVYVGEFDSDQRHGKGEFRFANRNVYQGEFCNGMFQGKGQYDFGSGKYNGEWMNGKYCGHGELTYTNGNSYVGEFQNSVAHGFGTETRRQDDEEVVVHRGVWHEGKPVKDRLSEE